MIKIPRVLGNFVTSFNLLRYGTLRQASFKSSLAHFSFVILIIVLLLSMIYYPSVFSIPGELKESLGGFEKANIMLDFSTEEPIEIGKKFIVFDSENIASPNSSKYYVDTNFLYYDYGAKRKELSNVGDILENKDMIIGFLNFLTIVLIPSFLVGFYIMSLFMVFLIIFLSSFVIMLILKLFKLKRGFLEIMNVGLYSSIFLFISVIARVLSFDVGRVFFIILFIVYFLVGTIIPSKKSPKKETNLKKSRKSKEIDDDYEEIKIDDKGDY